MQQFWNTATGPLHIPMTNDYLFRALLQSSNYVLKGLICSLIHLAPEEVSSAIITNPIELGKAIDEKTFILDVKVILNDSAIINLEIQVINEHNWHDRSLSYLCRSFDSLKIGDRYENVMPVIQISILDFPLFPDNPEFYATYKFLNVKNYTLYSDKLRLSVLDLTHINLATEEDKLYHIDHWAALFKAATWEELKMLAQDNEYINEASATIYRLSKEEEVRLQCEAREDYYRRQRIIQRKLDRLEQLDEEIENMSFELQNVTSELQNVTSELQNASSELQNVTFEKQTLAAENKTLLAEIQARKDELETQNAEIKAQNAEIQAQNAEIQAQNAEIQAQNAEIQTQNAEIQKLRSQLALLTEAKQ